MKRGLVSLLPVAIVLAGICMSTAACTSVRGGLGTSSSVCFRALPVGRSAVASPAPVDLTSSSTPTTKPPIFVGVRSASQKDLDDLGKKHDYEHTILTTRNGGPLKALCLVAFKGSFDPAHVKDLLGTVPPTGHRLFAVVVVSEPSNKVLATFIGSKEPISFTHYVVGG